MAKDRRSIMNKRICKIIYNLSRLDHVNDYSYYYNRAAEVILTEIGYINPIIPEKQAFYSLSDDLRMTIPTAVEKVDEELYDNVVSKIIFHYQKGFMSQL